MRIVKGDLLKLALQGHFDVIVHGCNCFNTMGAGIAKQIAHRWPQALEVDRTTRMADQNKLGTYTLAESQCCKIVNAYTQYRPRPPFDYDAFAKVLERLDHDFPKETKFGFPLIGCGLAGGDEIKVLRMIKEWAINRDVTVVRFE